MVENSSKKSPGSILQGEIDERLSYVDLIIKCMGYEKALEESEDGIRNYQSSLNPMAHAYAKEI
jgi:hypothetical protein